MKTGLQITFTTQELHNALQQYLTVHRPEEAALIGRLGPSLVFAGEVHETPTDHVLTFTWERREPTP